MAEINELKNCSLAVTYELDDTFDSEKFIKMRMKVCHDGINPNGSNFHIDDMNATQDSIKNIPILANVIFDEDGQPQFGGHDMTIEKDKVNEEQYRMVYQETPIGVVPETNNYAVEKCDGRNYVFVDGYIWRGYANYAEDIIERDKDIKLSMEITVNEFSFNAAKKVYNITDYKYTGITFLNNNFGTGMKNAMATTETFSEDNDHTEKMLMIMQELKEALVLFNKKNTEEGGCETMNDELKTNVSADNTPAPTEDFQENEGAATVPSQTENPEAPASDKYVKSFELSHDDIRCAIYALLEPKETENNDFLYIDEVFDGYFDYCSYRERTMYRQNYTKDGENVAFSGEPYEIFVVKVTADEKSSLDKMKADYSAMETELNSLREYRDKAEKAVIASQKEEIIAKWSEILKDAEQFIQLKNDVEKYSAEELDVKCKCIFADTKATFNFAAKPVKEQGFVSITVPTEPEIKTGRYGDLFDRFANKD